VDFIKLSKAHQALLFEHGEEGGSSLAEILRYLRHANTVITSTHAIHVNPGQY